MKADFPVRFVYCINRIKVMKKKYSLTAGLLLTIFSNSVGQTVKVPLTLDAWDTSRCKTYPGNI